MYNGAPLPRSDSCCVEDSSPGARTSSVDLSPPDVENPYQLFIPILDDSAEIQHFCRDVFPTMYEPNWYPYMLSCDRIYKLCYRYDGQLVALIVGQAEKRGFCSGTPQIGGYEEKAAKNSRRVVAYVMLLGVSSHHRRHGLGSRLLKCYMQMIKTTWPKMSFCFFLHVATDNRPAMEMYARFGFRKMQRIRDYYDFAKGTGGTPELHDAFLYTKEITPESQICEGIRILVIKFAAGVIGVISKVALVPLFPIQVVFRLCKQSFSARHQNAPSQNRPTKLVRNV